MALTPSKFDKTVQFMARGGASGTGLLLNADTIKLAFYTAAVAPAVTDVTYATTLAGGSIEVGAGVGYTVGGMTCGAGVTAQSPAGTENLKVTSNPSVVTASGAGFSVRYFVIYDSTPATNNLLLFWDYTSTLTLSGANSDTLTITFVTALTYATLA